mmetsp:Transcript_3849/g.7845  ORF Transcript_3849/g.7845 Transcript_3849/m.7845 type:complete len:144 (-) Transcript_3849:4905-5336(-)
MNWQSNEGLPTTSPHEPNIIWYTSQWQEISTWPSNAQIVAMKESGYYDYLDAMSAVLLFLFSYSLATIADNFDVKLSGSQCRQLVPAVREARVSVNKCGKDFFSSGLKLFMMISQSISDLNFSIFCFAAALCCSSFLDTPRAT